MESYQEAVLRATKLSFFLIENEIGEFPVGAHLLFFLVSYLESLLITELPITFLALNLMSVSKA